MMTIAECREFYARQIRFAANLTTPGLTEAFAKVPGEMPGGGAAADWSAEGRSIGKHARCDLRAADTQRADDGWIAESKVGAQRCP